MTEAETVRTYGLRLSDYKLRWAVIGFTIIISGFWMWALGIGVNWGSLTLKIAAQCELILFGFLYAYLALRMPKIARPFLVVSDFCLALPQVMAATVALAPLSYLAATANFPLRDSQLANLDAVLFGFNWEAASAWVASHPLLDWTLTTAYFSAIYQIVAVLLLASVFCPGQRSGEFIWGLFISVFLTCLIFAFVPALGKFGHVGSAPSDAHRAIRAGNWTVLDFDNFEGIITSPSFHTTLAVLIAYAARRSRLALAIFVPLDMVMVASTPTVGGHYVVDVFGGALVAGATIIATRLLQRHWVKADDTSVRTLAISNTVPS